MSAIARAFNTYNFPAIVAPNGDGALPGGQNVCLIHGKGICDALSWMDLPCGPCDMAMTAHVTVMELGPDDPCYLLVACRFDQSIEPESLLSPSLCPIGGVVEQTAALIWEIGITSLRRFVVAALTQPHAALGYWTAPASLGHHHNFSGGLAQHSLEVATMVASSTALPQEDRDVAIALAILHDYGKIWCYENGKYTSACKRGHVLIGLEKLLPLLGSLHRHSPAIANTMEELLGGRSQRTDRRYPLAVGRIVNAFDQFSCERARQRADTRQTKSDFDYVPY